MLALLAYCLGKVVIQVSCSDNGYHMLQTIISQKMPDFRVDCSVDVYEYANMVRVRQANS